jgi:translation elongation factor EF-G
LEKKVLVHKSNVCSLIVQVIGQMQDKLRLNCAPVQLPIGLEENHKGLIDLVKMKAFTFEGPHGDVITEVCCPVT